MLISFRQRGLRRGGDRATGFGLIVYVGVNDRKSVGRAD